ncbi:probable LRR receptor-like serine/threonine-protein kinase At1g53430 [Cucurbita maxima]|uniref:non-specific serine/threonine protein kinase n=1 Tax=Cucurbita maxima TaxID=3661 RepID=A0A6J1IP66_CUCMA|nr:probable LRR receptor-like serine/threonine-protein kinase At1g53430 [Cucurbita maxima]
MVFPTSIFTILGVLLLWILIIQGFGSHAQFLPEAEVKALQTISSKLKNLSWNVTRTSCIQGEGFSNGAFPGNQIMRNVSCNCTSTVCHVTIILLKGLNLTGTFPDEFGNLTHLKELDLTRNHINGQLPTSLANAPLVKLSLLGNRLNGSIPKEIGDIGTLEELVLEDNLLTGNLPPNLGNLNRLNRLLLSANNFTGRIPDSFGKLKNLVDFRIDGNGVSGKIPEFIGNWINLDRLDIQGTSMETPIPSTISQLKNLTQLRISDLKGSFISFPNLTDLINMEELVLRNCLINGSIPQYIGEMNKLSTLDLSFNHLTGPIPATFQNLIKRKIDFMFLTNNSLSGEVPGWILRSKKNIDLSYNNFSGSTLASCQQSPVNLVASYPPAANHQVPWCLKKDLPCSGKAEYHSLFINCGGTRLRADGHDYEEDLTTEGKSNFFSVSEKWAYSSTGVFLGDENADYLATNKLGLNVSGLGYNQNARLSPLSLKYYGLCLRSGSYNVKLHFAEIMYSNDQTFSSLGKRIFDISIQGKLVKKDFNIVEAAGGVGKNFTVEDKNVSVNGSTLEIHLYWAGKGTTAVPDRGVYGPLISAITVTPNFKIDEGGLSAGALAGIIISSCAVLIILVVVFLWMKGYICKKEVPANELSGVDLQTGHFTLKQIKAATNNFDPKSKIGEGGFGPVYKGVLSDGVLIAVKQLSSKSKQGSREFVTEIGMISALQHPNLVKLFGCCVEGNQLLLVYEYMENNSLARALFGREEQRLHLDWRTRKKICLEIARGLAYLHEESRLKIVHRDIKATNVLLDKDLTAKISDFGLAKLDEEENTHISTRIAGTIGYMAPEYAMRGYLTDKADVYSFGIVALEIVSGKSNTNYRPKEEFVYLLDWAYVLEEQGNLLELVDPDLGSNYSSEEAMRMLNIALLCTNPSPTLRPTMSSVVSMLEGNIPVQAPIIKRTASGQHPRFKAFEMLSHESRSQISSSTFSGEAAEAQKSMLMDGPCTDSAVSTDSNDKNLYHSASSDPIQNHRRVDDLKPSDK